MRNLFWILLLANVILFAVMQRGEFSWGDSGILAQPDLHSEMIRLLPAEQSAPSNLQTSAHSAPASISSVATADKSPLPAVAGKPICLQWSDFSGPELVRAIAALSTLHLGDKLSQHQIERNIGYWVYIPPLRSKASVNRKIAELKALGIREYFVMQNPGHWLNAISLGIFKTLEAAQNFHRHLQSKGVRSARVGERVGKLKATIFVLNAVDAATQGKLSAMQQDFAGSTLDTIPCALTR